MPDRFIPAMDGHARNEREEEKRSRSSRKVLNKPVGNGWINK